MSAIEYAAFIFGVIALAGIGVMLAIDWCGAKDLARLDSVAPDRITHGASRFGLVGQGKVSVSWEHWL